MSAVGHRHTWHDYLLLERTSNTRHEYFGGQIFAMAGGTPEHSALDVRVASQLDAQLEGRPCRVFNSDLRIRVQATGLGTYPDWFANGEAVARCAKLARHQGREVVIDVSAVKPR